jgi:hypothetical protein
MKRIPVLVLAAAGALAAPAFAGTVVYESPRTTAYVWDPVTGTYVESVIVSEPVYAAPQVTYVEVAPVAAPQTIIVTAPRDADEDYLVNSDVANAIAADPTIHGHVETQTYRGTATLGGRVTTPGMVDRVERDAKSVDGVRDVENLVRPVVGAS